MAKKYRTPRKQKKAEKAMLIRTIQLARLDSGPCLTTKEKRSLQWQRWTMLGIVYHHYVFTK